MKNDEAIAHARAGDTRDGMQQAAVVHRRLPLKPRVYRTHPTFAEHQQSASPITLALTITITITAHPPPGLFPTRPLPLPRTLTRPLPLPTLADAAPAITIAALVVRGQGQIDGYSGAVAMEGDPGPRARRVPGGVWYVREKRREGKKIKGIQRRVPECLVVSIK